jgi:hypothetical protein
MNHFYVPTKGTEDWRLLLAEPDKHWRDKRSAKMLATSWQSAGGFPAEVAASFRASAIPLFHDLKFVVGFPECKIPLPPRRRRPSQTDLMVIARADRDLIAIAVEGKVTEPFGELVRDWRLKESEGKTERLAFLCERLGLTEQNLDGIHYQLLHRTASALLAAEQFAARHALMLVHSFCESRTGFKEYGDFLQLFGLQAAVGTVQRAGALRDTELYFAWATPAAT